jgi:N utilization substance protein B
MSTRHIGRTLALQTLFELDIRDTFSPSKEDVARIVERDRDEFATGYNDTAFVTDLVFDIVGRRITIDDIITRAAPDWPLEKINTIDRNILRLGLCELLFSDRKEVPPKVAIDEAIELAKTFGGETSGKFINGVLGAVYKEIGEPGKEESTKKSEHTPKEKLAGAVVYSLHNGEVMIGLVHDVFGYWTLTKGRLEGEEDEEKLAKQKIKKEIGIDVDLITILGENEYIANKPEVGKVIKHVKYYLAHAPYTPLVLEAKKGLNDARWFPKNELKELKMYEDIVPLIDKAIAYIDSSA